MYATMPIWLLRIVSFERIKFIDKTGSGDDSAVETNRQLQGRVRSMTHEKPIDFIIPITEEMDKAFMEEMKAELKELAA